MIFFQQGDFSEQLMPYCSSPCNPVFLKTTWWNNSEQSSQWNDISMLLFFGLSIYFAKCSAHILQSQKLSFLTNRFCFGYCKTLLILTCMLFIGTFFLFLVLSEIG